MRGVAVEGASYALWSTAGAGLSTELSTGRSTDPRRRCVRVSCLVSYGWFRPSPSYPRLDRHTVIITAIEFRESFFRREEKPGPPRAKPGFVCLSTRRWVLSTFARFVICLGAGGSFPETEGRGAPLFNSMAWRGGTFGETGPRILWTRTTRVPPGDLANSDRRPPSQTEESA